MQQRKNSLTFAITGIKQLVSSIDKDDEDRPQGGVKVYPNPTSSQLNFSEPTDAAIYDATGARVRVVRSSTTVDIADLASGVYYIRTTGGATQQVVIQR